jgi:hypothetical protein
LQGIYFHKRYIATTPIDSPDQEDDILEQGPPIPFEMAQKLCEAYRNEHGVKKMTQCWGCLKFSHHDPYRMCFHNGEGNRGCPKVNRLFDER